MDLVTLVEPFFNRLVDYFALPARQMAQAQYKQACVITKLLLVLCLMDAVGYFVVLAGYSDQLYARALALLLISLHTLANALFLYCVRAGYPLVWISQGTLAFLYVGCFAAIYVTGGPVESPVVQLLIILPGFAFSMLDRNTAIRWTFAIWSTQYLFYFLFAIGYQFPELSMGSGIYLGRFVTWTTCYLGFVLFLQVYDSHINEGKRDRDRLQYLANHDQLTRLANRALFDERLNAAIKHCDRHGGAVALMYVDLDKFKPINDRFGHGVGDEVLQRIAERLLRTTRPQDTIARVGGDEFAVIIEHVDNMDVIPQIADAVLARVNAPISTSAGTISVAGSLGISLYPHDSENAEQLKRQADIAMYSAKRSNVAWKIYQPGEALE